MHREILCSEASPYPPPPMHTNFNLVYSISNMNDIYKIFKTFEEYLRACTDFIFSHTFA